MKEKYLVNYVFTILKTDISKIGFRRIVEIKYGEDVDEYLKKRVKRHPILRILYNLSCDARMYVTCLSLMTNGETNEIVVKDYNEWELLTY